MKNKRQHDLFKQGHDNVAGFIVFAWPLAVVLMLVAIILMWEDYATSKAGYLALPTLKVYDAYIPWAVAFIPMVGQIVLFYMYGRDTRRGFLLFVATGLFLVDIGTDSWYKSGGQWTLMPLAIVESLFIFTLGSEVLFTIAVTFLIEGFSDFVVAFAMLLRSISEAFSQFWSMIDER